MCDRGEFLAGEDYLDTSLLWAQEAALRKTLAYAKAKGEFNIADMFTKCLDKHTADKHAVSMGIEYKETQSVIALGIDTLERPKA